MTAEELFHEFEYTGGRMIFHGESVRCMPETNTRALTFTIFDYCEPRADPRESLVDTAYRGNSAFS